MTDMKRFLYLSLLLPLFLTGCSTINNSPLEGEVDTRRVIPPFLSEYAPYSFDAITDPAVWATFTTFEEQMAACQVPKKVLKNLSTEALVLTCMDFPLAFTYSAHNNPMLGIKVLLDGFNGLQELQTRADAAEALIAYYASIDIDKVAASESDAIGIGVLGYLELVMASNWIPSLYEPPYVSALMSTLQEQYAALLSHPDVFSQYSLRYAVMVAARVALSTQSLSDTDIALLTRFVENVVFITAEDYAAVLALVF
jgi:hypothetical protein